MLTISQLASYAGVTVRAVRHYHAKGLLPEPERDHSGYRRYDAAAVVELIRIRTLADAGVPLSRGRALLGAGEGKYSATRPQTAGGRRTAPACRSGTPASASVIVGGSPSWQPATSWRCRPRRSPTSTG